MSQTILSVKDLSVHVRTSHQEPIPILSNVSFDVKQECVTALVGGSGSGKTTTGLSMLRLLPPALTLTQGKIIFKGENLLAFSSNRMRLMRGRHISMIFQEPLYAFNPVFTIGDQIDELLMVHTESYPTKRRERILELLDMVGLEDPKRVAISYSHQLSGGMRQRAMIAQAIALNPAMIIADEPTSNLDVTLQARIIELFRKLRREMNLTLLLVTHDLGMVKHLADEIVVMSQGRVVESGSTASVLSQPQHAYTQSLIQAMEIACF